ncbi:MAG: PAS domain S-box protein [SAR202 cluster bacterium]|nr:PAS domain S-box protein [SAR202 cluster bacterium]
MSRAKKLPQNSPQSSVDATPISTPGTSGRGPRNSSNGRSKDGKGARGSNGAGKTNGRRGVEETLIGGEHSFSQMFDVLPAAIYTTDAEGRLTYFSPAAVEFSGRVPELGSDKWCISWKLYYPDGRPMPHDECPMAIALKEGRTVRGAEAIAERPDGKRIWFAHYPTPLRDAEGRITGGINMLVDISERRRAEEALWRKEQELTDFVENATIGLHWVGPDGRVIWVNQAEVDLLGYTREEYIGHHISEFHADQAVIEDFLRRLSNREELHSYEARLRCKDGSIKYVLIDSNVYWQGDRFIHTRCFTRDITERKQAEESLRRSEAEARRLLELNQTTTANMGEGMYTVDTHGLVTYMNPESERLFGWTSEELIGRRMHDVTHYKRPDGTPFPIEECAGFKVAHEGKVLKDFEDIFISKDRSFFPVSYSSSPLRDQQGSIVGLIVVFQDITERKRAEGERARLAAIVESTSDAIVSKDLNGTITSWNKGAERIFGYTAEEAIGRSITFIIPPDRIDEEQMNMGRIRRGERIEHYDTVRISKDGQRLPISLTISPLRDSAGKIIGASKIARDITERKRAEEQIKASLREKDVLLKEIHHRVKNNLQITLSLLSMQADEIRDPQARAKFQESQERIRSIALIHDKLFQSKDLAGIDMAGYIRNLADSLLHSYNVEPERVKVTLDADKGSLELDTAVLCGLILNELMTNAIKYAFPGGRKGSIRIEFREEEPGRFSLRVADDGVGLPAGLDFRKTESLGLQLANELTHQLRGTIELEQDALNGNIGTAFRIRFTQVGGDDVAWKRLVY